MPLVPNETERLIARLYVWAELAALGKTLRCYGKEMLLPRDILLSAQTLEALLESADGIEAAFAEIKDTSVAKKYFPIDD